MDFKSILNHFTKSKLIVVLGKFDDNVNASSWTKRKLVAHLEKQEPRSVLQKFTKSQLKEVLQENDLSASGSKSDFIERLLGDKKEKGEDIIPAELTEEERIELGHLFDSLTSFGGSALMKSHADHPLIKGKKFNFEGWEYLGRNWDYVDVSNHRVYAEYSRYFIHGDRGICVEIYEVPCEGIEVRAIHSFRVSKKNVTKMMYHFDGNPTNFEADS